MSDSLCLFVAEEHGVHYGHSNSNDDDDDDDKFFLGISHGAYAGIVCGILFVACVALLVALHYRKRYLVIVSVVVYSQAMMDVIDWQLFGWYGCRLLTHT